MTIREQRENLELEILSPFAVPSARTRGRAHPDKACQIRTAFQRDVDRILYSKAFRRLKHKTQVFLHPEGDHYRTRLTHTLEVSRIGRTIARALRLNEDLTEAIALGHDLGHTPFGHAGERVLDRLFPDGFRHYDQSARVVERLEKGGKGLNLCYETRLGIQHHSKGAADDPLEAQIVRIADRIAYINHDADDAIRAGVLTEEMIPLQVRETLGVGLGNRINTIVMDIIIQSENQAAIRMSPEVGSAVDLFRSFMFEAVYTNATVKGEEVKVAGILGNLYDYYIKSPDKLPGDYQLIREEDGLARAVCDYVSGMTDQYALHTYTTLFIPKTW